MIDAFIAYAPADKGFARLLDEVLSKRGVSTWARWSDSPPDSDEWVQIQAAIEASDNILYIITPEAAESRLVREQIEYAARHNKRFVPIIRRDPRSGFLNKAVRRYPLVYARDSEHFDSTLHQILKHINRDQTYIHTHTDLLIRSREWVLSGRKRRYLLRGKDLRAAEKWYVHSTTTEPKPAERQIEYIYASRRAREISQRQTLWVVMVAFVATFIFAGVTFSRLLIAPPAVRSGAAETKNAVATDLMESATADGYRTATGEALAVLGQTATEDTQTTLIAGGIGLATEHGELHNNLTVAAATQSYTDAMQATAIDRTATEAGAARVELQQTAASNDHALASATAAIGTLTAGDGVHATVAAQSRAEALQAQQTTVALAEVVTVLQQQRIINQADVAAGEQRAEAAQATAIAAVSTSSALHALVDSQTALLDTMTRTAAQATEAAQAAAATLTAHETEIAAARATAQSVEVALAAVESRASDLQSLVLADRARDALRNGEVDLALALAVEANRAISPPVEAQSVLGALAYRLLARQAFTGHHNFVYSVAISADGRRAASGSLDNTIRVWDTATARELQRIQGHETLVLSLAFSPDGSLLASGSQDGSVRLWDVTTGAEVRDFTGHSGWVTGVDFSPDGKALVSGAQDRSVRLWNVATGAQIWQASGHSNAVSSVEFSPSGATVLSSGRDGRLRLWDAATGDSRRVFGPGDEMLRDATFTGDGQQVVDSALRVWNVATGELAARFEHGPAQGVQTLDISPDDRWLITGSFNDNEIHLWDMASRSLVASLPGHTGIVDSLAFAGDSRLLVSGAWDNTPRLWDIGAGPIVTRYPADDKAVVDVAYSPDGRLAAAALSDGTVRVWDANSAAEVEQLSGRDSAAISIAFRPGEAGSAALLAGLNDGSLRLWEISSGRLLRRFNGHSDVVTSVAFSPDGEYVVSGSSDSTVRLWAVNSGRLLRRFDGHDDSVTEVTFSPNGRYIASASADHTIRLWDTETGQELRSFEGHSAATRAVAFSPDGRYLVSGSDDRTIRLWDTATAREIRRLAGHSAAVRAVAFSPDGRAILSGGWDDSARLWDVATGVQLQVIMQPDLTLNSLAWSPNGRYALLGPQTAAPALLRVRTPQELLQWTLQNRYVMSLTCEERILYRAAAQCDAGGNLPALIPVSPTPSPAATDVLETPAPTATDTPMFTPTP